MDMGEIETRGDNGFVSYAKRVGGPPSYSSSKISAWVALLDGKLRASAGMILMRKVARRVSD